MPVTILLLEGDGVGSDEEPVSMGSSEDNKDQHECGRQLPTSLLHLPPLFHTSHTCRSGSHSVTPFSSTILKSAEQVLKRVHPTMAKIIDQQLQAFTPHIQHPTPHSPSSPPTQHTALPEFDEEFLFFWACLSTTPITILPCFVLVMVATRTNGLVLGRTFPNSTWCQSPSYCWRVMVLARTRNLSRWGVVRTTKISMSVAGNSPHHYCTCLHSFTHPTPAGQVHILWLPSPAQFSKVLNKC